MRPGGQVGNTQPRMASHLTRTDRTRRWAILAVALGVGLAGFLLAGADDDSEPTDQAAPGTSDRPSSTSPTVLGAVVTPSSAPEADPAAPVDVTLDATATSSGTARPRSTNSGPGTTRPAGSSTTTTVGPTTTSPPGSTTEPPPTIIEPTVIENTTTTEPTTTTTEP